MYQTNSKLFVQWILEAISLCGKMASLFYMDFDNKAAIQMLFIFKKLNGLQKQKMIVLAVS